MSERDSQLITWAITAGENLNDLTSGTGHLYKAIDADGTIATNGTAFGILQEGGVTGQGITLGVANFSKFVAGAAIAAGARLTVTTSGYFITATSGSYIVGRNKESAISSGSVGTGFFDFSIPRYAVSSLV